MKAQIGDILEIHLSNGEFAYTQYVYWDKTYGPLVQVFDLISREHAELKSLVRAGPLFPPVIMGLSAAVKSGLWKIIGNLPVINFHYPKFVSTEYDEKSGKAGVWHLWDGTEWEKIGNVLPDEYQTLEFLIVWNPKDVVERIETRKDPFPYTDLKKRNRFDLKLNN